ncbi:MAG: site-specific integrase [Chloroflexota bacterium]|nr:site-specific integrase [Chloroflexota bacterium]
MRGYIRKRGKNSYSLTVSLGRDPETGKYRQHTETVKGTKRDADKRLAELLHQLDTGAFMSPGKTTVADYLERWLADYAQANLAPRTFEGYRTIIRGHLIPGLGQLPLTRLKPEHIQRYYSDMLSHGRADGKGALSPRTVRHHHMVLHKALDTAVKWGLLSRNPADAISPPRCQSPQWHTLGEHDIQVLLEAAKSTPYYAFFYTALFTGMRRSEILALRWCDVDLVMCQAYVRRALHHLLSGEVVIRPPKSATGSRTVALTPSTAIVLKEHREKQQLEAVMIGRTVKDDDLVFSTIEGRALLPNTVTHAWRNLVRRLGLGNVRLHDCRHSHASLLLKQGVHPKVVQERLGHSSITLTLDTYSHVTPGLQEAAAKRFDEVLARPLELEPSEGR